MTSYLRKLVSGPKARHVDDDLNTDLDLAYITDRLIAMGWPASSLEALYRNSRKDVKRFLEAHHKGKYRIYNLCPCSENSYDKEFFDGRVSRFPFPDHHAPPLSLVAMHVVDMTEWLRSDEENVAVIHCKAGKGRTGTMACSYLLSLPVLPSAPTDQWKLGKQQTNGDQDMRRDLEQTAKASQAGSAVNDEAPRGASHDEAESSLREAPTTPTSETIDLDARLRAVFELHTSRRLRSKKSESAQAQTLDKAFIDQGPAGADSASSSRASSTTDLNSMQGPESRGGAEKPSNRERLKALGARPSGTSRNIERERTDSDVLDVSSGTDSDEDNVTAEAYGKAAVPRWAVSIPSQRRFVGYWARVLAGADARSSLRGDAHRLRQVRITKIEVDRLLAASAANGDNDKAKGSQSVTIQLARYDQDYETRLLDWEKDVRGRSSSSFADIDFKTEAERVRAYDWGDNGKAKSLGDATDESKPKGQPRLDYFAVVRESGHKSILRDGKRDAKDATSSRLIRHTYAPGDAATTTQAAPSVPTWARTSPQHVHDAGTTDATAGLVVDADRGLMIKVLSGRSGASHSLLPDMASCGYAWFVPSFETPNALWSQAGEHKADMEDVTRVRCAFGPGEIDFRKGKRVAKILGGEILRISVEWELLDG